MKLGLVMGSLTPRPLARPRTKVVFPAPTSPMSSMTFWAGPAAAFSPVVAVAPPGVPQAASPAHVNLLLKLVPKSSISCSE